MPILDISNHWKVIITHLPALVITFIPLFTPNESIYKKRSFEDINELLRTSKLLFGVFSFCLGVCFPLIIDLTSEYLRDIKSSSPKPRIHWVKQLMIMSSILGPTLSYFLTTSWREGGNNNSAQILVCFLAAQRLFIVPPFLLGMSESPSGIFNSWKMVVLIFVASGHAVFLPYWEVSGRAGFICTIVTYAMLVSGIALVWYMGFEFTCKMYQFGKLPREEYVTVLYFIPVTICCIGVLYTLVLVQPLSRYDEITIILFMSGMCAVAAVAILQPAKMENIYKLSKAIDLLDMKKSFVRYISHEIRTPLNAAVVGMSLVTDLLPLLPESARAEADTAISQITEALDVAVEILNELLTYDKITSKLLTLEKTLENPVALVTSTLSMFQLQAQKKRIEFSLPALECEAAVQLSRRLVKIDVHKMKQVLRNFASNALKFTPTGGHITVQVGIVSRCIYEDGISRKDKREVEAADAVKSNEARRHSASSVGVESDWFRLEVIDSGAGIAAENLPRVFKEIIQFDANKLQEGKGTGLGLFISRGIVELHGGRVGVESEGLGRGCTFWFELPLISSDASSGEISPRTNRNTAEFGERDPWAMFGKDKVEPLSLGSVHSSNDAVAGRSGNSSPSHSQSVIVRKMFSSRALAQDSLQPPSPCDTILPATTPGEVCIINDSSAVSRRNSSILDCTEPFNQNIGEQSLSRVLIVDDSVVSSKMMAALVTKLGVVVDVAEDGMAAVEKVRQSMAENRPYDVVVMDNNMPRMNGPEACREMRALGFSNPVFGLTGDVTDLDREVFMTAGAMEVFSKPLNVEAFKTKLKACLKCLPSERLLTTRQQPVSIRLFSSNEESVA